MEMKKTKNVNIANLLSYYRIFISPVILFFAISRRENLFAVFLIINLVSDVIDGYIARKYNMESEFGARLDTIADNFTYILALTGIFVFKLDDLRPHLISFLFFVGMMSSTQIVSLLRFGRFPSFHLYSTKIGGYIQGAFFIVLFAWDFVTPLFYFMVVWGILSAAEHIVIQLVIPEMRSNVKGLYWVLKDTD